MGKVGKYLIRPTGRPPIYDYKKINALVQKGVKPSVVAKEAGCPVACVYKLRYRRKRENALTSDIVITKSWVDYKKINRAYWEKKSDFRIAQEVGCGITTVSKWRQSKKLPPHKDQSYTPDFEWTFLAPKQAAEV